MEVVEDVLLLAEHSRAMPALAVFPTTAQVREREETAGLDPRRRTREVRRGPRDVETAVAREERWHVAGRLRIRTVHEKHRDRGAVSRVISRLFHGDARDIQARRYREPCDLA